MTPQDNPPPLATRPWPDTRFVKFLLFFIPSFVALPFLRIPQLALACLTVTACSSCAIQKGFEFYTFLPPDSRQELHPATDSIKEDLPEAGVHRP